MPLYCDYNVQIQVFSKLLGFLTFYFVPTCCHLFILLVKKGILCMGVSDAFNYIQFACFLQHLPTCLLVLNSSRMQAHRKFS